MAHHSLKTYFQKISYMSCWLCTWLMWSSHGIFWLHDFFVYSSMCVYITVYIYIYSYRTGANVSYRNLWLFVWSNVSDNATIHLELGWFLLVKALNMVWKFGPLKQDPQVLTPTWLKRQHLLVQNCGAWWNRFDGQLGPKQRRWRKGTSASKFGNQESKQKELPHPRKLDHYQK